LLARRWMSGDEHSVVVNIMTYPKEQ